MRCTKLVRIPERVCVQPATARDSARWETHYRFAQCGQPAVGSNEASAWCEAHSKPRPENEKAQ